MGLRVCLILLLGEVCFLTSFHLHCAESGEGFLQPGSGLETSAEGRKFLKYAIDCALPKGAHVKIAHDNSVDNREGVFGLAQDWLNGPLSDHAMRWVSACYLALVNGLGVHVYVSLRGNHPALIASVTEMERSDFPYQEAAFYGNVFSEQPIAYVCSGASGPMMSPARARRICSDLSPNAPFTRCNMVLTGKCSDVCSVVSEKDHYVTRCKGGNEIYEEVVTVFLPVRSEVVKAHELPSGAAE